MKKLVIDTLEFEIDSDEVVLNSNPPSAKLLVDNGMNYAYFNDRVMKYVDVSGLIGKAKNENFCRTRCYIHKFDSKICSGSPISDDFQTCCCEGCGRTDYKVGYWAEMNTFQLHKEIVKRKTNLLVQTDLEKEIIDQLL